MKTLLIVVQLIPYIIDIIKAVEKLCDKSGCGSEKLKLVEDILTQTYSGIEEHLPTIQKIIGTVVSFANRTGVFKKDV